MNEIKNRSCLISDQELDAVSGGTAQDKTERYCPNCRCKTKVCMPSGTMVFCSVCGYNPDERHSAGPKPRG